VLPLPVIIQYFASYLRNSYDLKHNTIAQYISHTSKLLVEEGLIVNPDTLQSHRLKLILGGFAKEDAVNHPLRLSIKIPITYPIAVEVMLTIDAMFSFPLNLALRASLAIGYSLSLRPNEYLLVYPRVPIEHQANSSLSVFWFGDTYFNVCTPASYPPNRRPSAFSTMVDHTKNDTYGKGGPRTVFESPYYIPNDPTNFCSVAEIFTFLVAYPPLPNSPILSGLGEQVSCDHLNHALKVTARRLGLDPDRMLPHGIRAGALEQIEAHDEYTKLMQGNWSTREGMLAYARRSVKHAKKIAADLHHHGLCPITHTQYMYNTTS
jgi:hypothetical protein